MGSESKFNGYFYTHTEASQFMIRAKHFIMQTNNSLGAGAFTKMNAWSSLELCRLGVKTMHSWMQELMFGGDLAAL